MHSRIGRAKFRTDKGDDVIRVAQESVATFKRQPGFQSVLFHQSYRIPRRRTTDAP
jgi:hypothetical protein